MAPACLHARLFDWKHVACKHACMRTIVVNSQKGGSGKTALCAHLSVQAERSGDGPVYLIDTDPQGTLSQWHELRQADSPKRVEVPVEDLVNGVALLAQRGASYCFVDTAPTRSGETAALFRLADLVLVPIVRIPPVLGVLPPLWPCLQPQKSPSLSFLNRARASAG